MSSNVIAVHCLDCLRDTCTMSLAHHVSDPQTPALYILHTAARVRCIRFFRHASYSRSSEAFNDTLK